MDWSLDHYDLPSYERCWKAKEFAQRVCYQASFLTWLSAQATRSSSANRLIDDIVLTELLRRGSYQACICGTHVLKPRPIFWSTITPTFSMRAWTITAQHCPQQEGRRSPFLL